MSWQQITEDPLLTKPSRMKSETGALMEGAYHSRKGVLFLTACALKKPRVPLWMYLDRIHIPIYIYFEDFHNIFHRFILCSMYVSLLQRRQYSFLGHKRRDVHTLPCILSYFISYHLGN